MHPSACFHTFPFPVDSSSLPKQFNCPFHYTPHPLCIEASRLVQAYIRSRSEWQEELSQGKMFGVLVVRTAEHEIGFLAAYSGNLSGRNDHEFFVPPVYDLLHPDGFFHAGEAVISSINRQIQHLESSAELARLQTAVENTRQETDTQLQDARMQLKQAKASRDRKRKEQTLTPEEQEALIHESQHQKAAYKRLEHTLQQQNMECKEALDRFLQKIEQLKQERKVRSAALQQKLFEQFVLLNARGEKKDLCTIFASTSRQIPPAGSGECAAPKLLQYAYLHQMQPIVMAEFWWGKSPKQSIRRQGDFYPSCQSKCAPILGHMLQGLNVAPNPLHSARTENTSIGILYEDDFLLIVNKPEGILSVPGKHGLPSVWQFASEHCPGADGPLIVHRLDMATSGILVIAKNKEVHQALQAQFEQRTVKKRYTALLEHPIDTDAGIIRLPLSPDYEDRPHQLVDFQAGKPAVTRYQVEGQQGEFTRILFWPLTGRTHQLRVHAAHPDGLNSPIVGDTLYGHSNQRLYLHADSIEFRHPVSNRTLRIHCPAPF